MHGEVVPFLFEEKHLLRSIRHNDDPAWFAGPDVARILGYRDAANALRTLDDDEKGTHILSTLGGSQTIKVVSEPGLYRCILQRREVETIEKEKRDFIARFQRWVFHDVLPTIRKTGRYEMPRADAQAMPPFTMATEDARKENIRTRRQLVSEARQTHGTNAARELWAYLGLPIVPAMMSPGAPELPFTYTAVKHEPEPQREDAA